MKSKFKIGDQVTCGDRANCTVIDIAYKEHMDEHEYMIFWNEEFTTVLERELKPHD